MEHRSSENQQRKPKPLVSCLVVLLLATAFLTTLSGFWLFFTRVIAPRIPRHVEVRPEAHPGVGTVLDVLELKPLTGNSTPLSIADVRGHIVLLNFWGTWCPPCREELPHLAAIAERFSGRKEFRLVAISYPAVGSEHDFVSLRDETASLLKRLELDLPTYWDPEENTISAVDMYIGFKGFPTSVLLDYDGVIRAVWVGYRPGMEAEIERRIDNLLAEHEESNEPRREPIPPEP